MSDKGRHYRPLEGRLQNVAAGPVRSRATPAWTVGSLAWLGLAVLVCVALDSFRLGHPSLWNDEFFSRYYYDLFGLRSMLTDGLQREPTPPTYFILLRGWMALFGDSEAALRSLSVVAYAACVPAAYRLARAFGPARDALLAAFLFSLSPFGLHFAQEARVYALTLLPASLVLLACAGVLDGTRPRQAAWLYVLSGTACLYLHATLVFLMAAAAMTVAGGLMLQHRSASWRPLLRWVALNAAVVVLASPYLVHLPAASQGSGLDWIAPLRPRDVVAAVAAMTSGVLTPLSWAALTAALLIGALAWSMLQYRPSMPMLAVIVVIPGVFLGLLVVVSLVRPVLLPRVLCWTIVPLCVLTARQMLGGGRLRWIVIAATVLAFGTGLVTEETTPNAGREPWRDAYADLGPALRQADLIVLGPHASPLHMLYYGPGTHNVRMWDANVPNGSFAEAARRLHIDPIGNEQILAAIKAGEKVVLLANTMDSGYLDSIAAGYPPTHTKSWACGYNDCIEAMTWGQ